MYLELTPKTKLNLASFILKICETKRHKRLDTHSAKVFKTLCDELLHSTTVAAYEAAKWQLHAFIADQADSNDSLCIDLKSFHCPKMQRKNSKRQNSLWQVANNASTHITNTMPTMHTAAYQQVQTHQQYQHLFQQLPYPKQSVAYNPTGPVLQLMPKLFIQ